MDVRITDLPFNPWPAVSAFATILAVVVALAIAIWDGRRRRTERENQFVAERLLDLSRLAGADPGDVGPIRAIAASVRKDEATILKARVGRLGWVDEAVMRRRLGITPAADLSTDLWTPDKIQDELADNIRSRLRA